MTFEVKPLPCPFCGGEAVAFQYRDYSDYPNGKVWDVHCERRDCYLCDGAEWDFDTKEEAIAKWNDRK